MLMKIDLYSILKIYLETVVSGFGLSWQILETHWVRAASFDGQFPLGQSTYK